MSKKRLLATGTAGAAWVLAVVIGLSAGPVSAGESRWYLKSWVGQSSVDVNLDKAHFMHLDDESAAVGVEGGYLVHRFLGIQAGYHDLGEHQGLGWPCSDPNGVCIERLATELGVTVDELSLCVEGDRSCLIPEYLVPISGDVSAFSLSLVPRWPITERFAVYAKVGIIDWNTDLSYVDYGGLRVRDRVSEQDLLTGAGAEVSFANGLSVGLEYQRLESDVETASLGLGWRF